MLSNWVVPSPMVKKNPTATCLFGQFRKINPWLSWALPLAGHECICIFIAPAEFSELTNVKHFYHLSFSIWNCKLMSSLTTLLSASPAKLQAPNTRGLPLPSLSLDAPMRFSCLCSLELDSARALLSSTSPVPWAGENIKSQAVSGPASHDVLAASHRKTG